MYIKSVIEEIETYLKIYPLRKEKRPISLVFPSGQSGKSIAGMRHLAYFGDVNKPDETIYSQLANMDEESLDQLIEDQGDESMIAQIIRRKRANEYAKISCSLEGIEASLKQEIKDAKKEGNQFFQTICDHIERLGYKTDSDYYNAINMTRQQFSRLRDPSNTLSKKTVLWIIVTLHLDYDQACDLLQKAGYRFRKGDLRDVILMYIFRNTTYDLYEVNQVLDHFGIAPLG